VGRIHRDGHRPVDAGEKEPARLLAEIKLTIVAGRNVKTSSEF